MLYKERIFYIIAVIILLSLLLQSVLTLIISILCSIFTYPFYRKLRLIKRRKILGKEKYKTQICLYPNLSYALILLISVLAPFAVLLVLVIPQISDGLILLHQLKNSKFQLPQAWIDTYNTFRVKLSSYPHIDKIVTDFINNVDSFINDLFMALVNKGMEFLGGTMSFCWSMILFFILTILFSNYAIQSRTIVCRITQLPVQQVRRFVRAVNNALHSVLLGIVLVAIIQGFLSGIGFAVAGVKQPAFWGLLSTFAAPIPFVGTVFVWLPLAVSIWFSGNTFAAISLAVWSILIVEGSDNILQPLFLRQGIRAPLSVLLLTIVCGITVFGPIGLIIAPVMLAIAIQLIAEADLGFDRAR